MLPSAIAAMLLANRLNFGSTVNKTGSDIEPEEAGLKEPEMDFINPTGKILTII